MSYLNFLWRSKNEHRIHSPFVYELQMNVFKDGMYYYGFDYLAKYLETEPSSKKEKKKLRQLFRLVNYFTPKHTIEISDDLSTFSLALALPSKKNDITYFCKNEDTKNAFHENLKTKQILELENHLSSSNKKLDFIFINSSEDIRLIIKKIKPFTHQDTCIVINSPHKQKENWDNIINSKEFNVSIDLYEFGILFDKKTQTIEHFILRS